MATAEVIRDLDQQFKYAVAGHPGGENIKYCFSCGTCTATCPVADVEDSYNPRKIIRMALLGMKKEVLSSEILWQCASCFACFARCPQNVKVADLMQALREMAVQEGVVPKELLAHIDTIDALSHRIRLSMIKAVMESGSPDTKVFKERIGRLLDETSL